MEDPKRISKVIAYAIFVLSGFAFLFFNITGYELAEHGNLVWTWKYTLSVLGISLTAGGTLGAVLCFLLYRAAANRSHEADASREGLLRLKLLRRAPGTGALKVFLGSLFLIVLSWLPIYLAYYPAICAYDTFRQTEQIMLNSFTDHHPVLHTLLLKWSMELGEAVFGSINEGIGFYALVQLLFLAAAFALGITFLWQYETRFLWLVLLQLFCMVYPFHFYMSVSVTKDTIFSAFFVMLVLALCNILQEQEYGAAGISAKVLFFCSSVGVILFRNNGRYAYFILLLFLILMVLFGKGKRRFFGKLLLWTLGAFIVGNVTLSAIFNVTGAMQGDRREMLSIPIQQLARTMIYHGGVGLLPEDDGTMVEQDKALLNEFILNEAYRYYRPDIADPVKNHTNTYVVRYRTREFIDTYIRLLLKYPGEFINAVLAIDAGYLYPGDVTHAFVNTPKGEVADGGYAQTRWDEVSLNAIGIYKASKWPWLYEKFERWADENAYLNLPGIKYLFVPGIWLYLYLLLLGWLVIRRAYRFCLPLAGVFGYYLTLFLGPTVQLRYIYPLMITFPFLLLWSVRYVERTGELEVLEQKLRGIE